MYTWSILKAPLAEAFGFSSQQLAAAYTVLTCLYCAGSLLAGKLSETVPVKVLLVAGGLMSAAGFYIISRAESMNMAGLCICYGALIGAGTGAAYNTLISVGNAWFTDRQGTSSGIMMMCFGVSTLLLGKLSDALFAAPDFGWRRTYVALGLIILAVLVLCALLLKYPGAGEKLPSPAEKPGKSRRVEHRDYSAGEMLRRPSFWLYYVYGILSASVGSAVISFARELSTSMGATASGAATLVGLLSVFNGLGRVLCGLSCDSLGRRVTMFISNLTTLVSPLVMIAALLASSLPLAVVSLCLIGLSFGSNPTISSALISEFYGRRYFSINYSISNTKLLFSSLAATAAGALLQSTGGYLAPFIMLASFAAVALGMSFLIRHP